MSGHKAQVLPIASLPIGQLQGTWENGVAIFRGVPFAAPPIGDLRFAPPQPPVAWKGVRAADRHGPIAPQTRSRLARVIGDFTAEQSEDCLNLTVWTPDLSNELRPVMVWIHGGAYVSGGSSLPWFDGASFAREHGVVVVGVNYRLGPLGYLYLPGVSPGNLGLLDQIASLRWVQENIAAFGGDPSSVTVAGSSAGASSIYCMLASPAAQGLFRRAVMQSGPYSMLMTPDEGERTARKLAECAGVSPSELSSLPVERLLSAQADLVKLSSSFAMPGTLVRPVIDGTLIPTDHLSSAVAGAKDCAIVLGWNRDEQNTFFVGDEEIETASYSKVASAVEQYCGSNWRAVLQAYREHNPGAGPSELLTRIAGGLKYIEPAQRFAELLAKERRQVWVYRFDWSAPGNPFGACHCIELPFVFNNCSTYRRGGALMLDGSTNEETSPLGRAVQKSWANYIVHGDPGHLGTVHWPRYDSSRQRSLRIGNVIEVTKEPSILSSV